MVKRQLFTLKGDRLLPGGMDNILLSCEFQEFYDYKILGVALSGGLVPWALCAHSMPRSLSGGMSSPSLDVMFLHKVDQRCPLLFLLRHTI